MNKIKRIFSAVAALLIILSMLSACGKGNKFAYSESGIRDKKTDITYIDAPPCYSPIAILDEEVYGHSDDYLFYAVLGVSPTRFVCDTEGTLFYADSEKLPKFSEMQLMYFDICSDASSAAVKKTVDAKESVNAVRDAYLHGETIYYPNFEAEKLYEITDKIISENIKKGNLKK